MLSNTTCLINQYYPETHFNKRSVMKLLNYRSFFIFGPGVNQTLSPSDPRLRWPWALNTVCWALRATVQGVFLSVNQWFYTLQLLYSHILFPASFSFVSPSVIYLLLSSSWLIFKLPSGFLLGVKLKLKQSSVPPSVWMMFGCECPELVVDWTHRAASQQRLSCRSSSESTYSF